MKTFKLASMFVVAILFVGAGCAPKKSAKKDASSDSAQAGGPLTAPQVEVAEAEIRGREFVESADLAPIHFDYDAYSLDEPARTALKKNADYLKIHPDLEVLVAGHCDERGTIQYNLALGQQRAKAVRDYYMRLGVGGKSVATISYGEEKPACADLNENCWSVNRRAETRIRSQMANGHKDNKVSHQ